MLSTWGAEGPGGLGNISTKDLLSQHWTQIFSSPSQPITLYFTPGCHKPTYRLLHISTQSSHQVKQRNLFDIIPDMDAPDPDSTLEQFKTLAVL